MAAGRLLQADAGQNPARQAAVAAGIPVTVPSISLNKFCPSGRTPLRSPRSCSGPANSTSWSLAGWSP